MASPSSSGKRLTGFINKIEQRSIGGPTRRKYWFALCEDSPYLYWYKNKVDVACMGRLSLSGAAFTFDPREMGRFEIHVNDEIHILETADNKSRLLWLRHLQSNRRRHYEKENADDILKVEVVSLSSHSGEQQSSSPRKHTDMAEEVIPGPIDEKSLEDELEEADKLSQSTFYLNADGELNARSMDMPPLIRSPNRDIVRSAEAFLIRVVDETSSLKSTEGTIGEETVSKKTSRGFKLPSLGGPTNKGSCDQCKELLEIVNQLKDRCYELTDEVGANQDLVNALRHSVLSAHNQIAALRRVQTLNTAQEQVDFILERESSLTALQLNLAEQRRELQKARDSNRQLEAQNQELSASVDAFRDSLRSKEELLLQMCGDEGKPVTIEHEVPEGILVDINADGTPEAAQRLCNEASVNDVNEMKDLVEGYRTQNNFLNQEVLELQRIVQSLEDRERRHLRREFDIEACYYQLKSRYLMVLNHFKSTETPSKILQPGVLHEMILEANRGVQLPPAIGRTMSPDQHRNSGVTDSLGFYVSRDGGQHPTSPSSDMMESAAEYKRRADDIIQQQGLEQSPEYMEWLTKWDGFLVNYVSRPLNPSNELKALVRTGVPKTYRHRVWKSLVHHLVNETKADLGSGYYEMLLRKSKGSEDTYDSALKQIDLDLSRTLPTNKHFDDPSSSKIGQLRRVLYAYRFHNRAVGYCQGLNRLAAIGLLCLEESDAFWFLSACVESLQPPDYYTPSLICAVADQNVHLVMEKLPKLCAHLKQADVDLSLFTLSWFLTVFVDALPHSIYMQIFDVFLYEGNKVLFRFALALLKLCEPRVLECRSVGGIHACLSKAGEHVANFKALSQVAFSEMNPFPLKHIETRRQFYLNQLKVDDKFAFFKYTIKDERR